MNGQLSFRRSPRDRSTCTLDVCSIAKTSGSFLCACSVLTAEDCYHYETCCLTEIKSFQKIANVAESIKS